MGTIWIGTIEERTGASSLVYRSEQFREADLDPTLLQPDYTKVDLAFLFGPQGGAWEVADIGKHIFDERTFSYGNNSPLLEGARRLAPDWPRTIAVRALVRF